MKGMNFWQESSSGLRRVSDSQEEEARKSSDIKATTDASYCRLQTSKQLQTLATAVCRHQSSYRC